MIGKKPPNLHVRYFLGKKPGGIEQERGLGLFCLLGGGGPRRSTSFPLYPNVCGGLDCWPERSRGLSHRWSHINGSGCRCWLLWIVFVVDGDEFLKVLNCRYKLPGILLLRIAFPRDQIVKP